MTGVSAIQYFSITIFGQIGIGSSDALKYQAINNILALVAQVLCILFIDRLGRRRPLIIGNLVNSLMFLIATVLIGESSRMEAERAIITDYNRCIDCGN